MAQILNETKPVATQDSKKERKKQAKREAKTMLKVKKAQKDVERAERKVTKAQVNLQTSKDQLHKFEEKLTQMRATQDSHNGVVAVNPESTASAADSSVDEQPQVQENQAGENEGYTPTPTEADQANSTTTSDEATPVASTADQPE